MTTDEPRPSPKRRRRRWSLSVRGLMLLVLAVGRLIGWEVNRVARMRRAVAILLRGSEITPGNREPILLAHRQRSANFGQTRMDLFFDDEYSQGVFLKSPRPTWLPFWFRRGVGLDHFKHVSLISFNQRPEPLDWEAIEALGFIERLDFVGVHLRDEDLARLPNRSGLRELWLSQTVLTDKAMASIGTLRDLRVLDVGGTEITDVGLTSLEGLTDLETLMIASPRVTDLGLKSLHRLKRLRSVDVTANVSDGAIASLRAALPSLRVIRKRPWPDFPR